MSTTEILVVAFGLFLGYWIVAKLIGGGASTRETSAPVSDPSLSSIPVAEEASSVEWHEVLEVDRTASVAQIRAAYARLSEQYRPEKVAELGEDIRQLARQRLAQIEVAYREALRERGYE